MVSSPLSVYPLGNGLKDDMGNGRLRGALNEAMAMVGFGVGAFLGWGFSGWRVEGVEAVCMFSHEGGWLRGKPSLTLHSLHL